MEEVLDAYHRGGATTTMGDGTTMSREDVLKLVIAKSEAEDPETEFYFVPRDVVLAFQAAPPSSSAEEEDGGQHASLPRFQTLLEQEQLVKKKVSLRGAVRGLGARGDRDVLAALEHGDERHDRAVTFERRLILPFAVSVGVTRQHSPYR